MAEETPCEACPSCAVCATCPKVEEVSASEGPVAVPTSAADNTRGLHLGRDPCRRLRRLPREPGHAREVQQEERAAGGREGGAGQELERGQAEAAGVHGGRVVRVPAAAARRGRDEDLGLSTMFERGRPRRQQGPMNSTRVEGWAPLPAQVQRLEGGGGGGRKCGVGPSQALNVCVSNFK